MPTGTRNDWSGISQSTPQDDPLIPTHAKSGLNEVIRSKEGNSLFLQNAFNEGMFLSTLYRGTPDVKAISCYRLEQAGGQQSATRSTRAEKKKTGSHGSPFSLQRQDNGESLHFSIPEEP
jgi:hypothetical protein